MGSDCGDVTSSYAATLRSLSDFLSLALAKETQPESIPAAPSAVSSAESSYGALDFIDAGLFVLLCVSTATMAISRRLSA
jgi:hypothetical protein